MGIKVENLWTGPGRLIMGSLTEKQDKNLRGEPIPESEQRYFFGIAVPKTEPAFNDLWTKLFQMAAADYAAVPLVMNQINQGLAAPQFAWKIDDGDAPQFDSRTGQAKANPTYKQGCWIIKFNTSFPVACCDSQNRDIAPADIKRGDYVDLIFNAQSNGAVDHTAGIYLNPVAMRRLGFGDAISGAVQASNVFGQAPAAVLPPGASLQPTAAAPAPLPAGASLPGQAPAVHPTPQPGYAPAPMPGGSAVMPGAPGLPGAPPLTASPPTSAPMPPPYPGVMGR